jgi:hypothetical protein
MRPPCSDGRRHRFRVPGEVELRSPICLRCGSDNPRPLSARERGDFQAFTGGVGPEGPGDRHGRPIALGDRVNVLSRLSGFDASQAAAVEGFSSDGPVISVTVRDSRGRRAAVNSVNVSRQGLVV